MKASAPKSIMFIVATVAVIVGVKFYMSEQQQRGPDSLAYIDAKIRPQDDLFKHVNGQWLDNFKIPEDKQYYGALIELREKVDDDLKVIMQDLSSQAEPSAKVRQVLDLYHSFMATDNIEALGLKPVKPLLDAISNIDSREKLLEEMASLHWLGVPIPVGIGVSDDTKVLDANALYAGQSGLGMPSRDYYLLKDPKYVAYQQAYRQYIQNIFKLANLDVSSPDTIIYELESKIAQAHWDKVALRDSVATYNKISLQKLQDDYSKHFAWLTFLDKAHFSEAKHIILTTPSYFKAFDDIYGQHDLETWKIYLKFKVLNSFASYLPKEFEQEAFNFFGKKLKGLETQEPREKRALRLVDHALGESLGEAYAAKHFLPESKEHLLKTLSFVKLAFKESIENNTWMQAQTKTKALEKLEAMGLKIGYPETFKDYSSMTIKADSLVSNIFQANIFESQEDVDKLSKPVDKNEWHMLPHTVNAYYSPSKNEICFPAGILQSPVFDLNRPDVENYGAAAAIIGHEISHGFDDQGRKYDAKGQLVDWWTEEDAKAFEMRTQKLIAQYDAFEPFDGTHVNGQLTLGENIADLTGLHVSYRAYQLAYPEQNEAMPAGVTPTQLFFMSWASTWRTKYREDALRSLLLIDPHSPGAYRCNGVVSHLTPFYEAFHVTEKDKMYIEPSKRVKIWF